MKTKQIFACGVLLMLAGAGVVFAQEAAKTEEKAAAPGSRKNAISMDTMPLFRGFIASDSDTDTFFFCMTFAYERLIASHFTIGGEIDLYPGRVGRKYEVYPFPPPNDKLSVTKISTKPYFYFAMAANARFYPMSEYMEKFFLGVNLGFNVQAIDGEAGKNGGFAGLTAGLNAGYKLLLGKMFFLEPAIAYTYSKSGGSSSSDLESLFGGSSGSSFNPLNGWQAGLRAGITF